MNLVFILYIEYEFLHYIESSLFLFCMVLFYGAFFIQIFILIILYGIPIYIIMHLKNLCFFYFQYHKLCNILYFSWIFVLLIVIYRVTSFK